MFGMIIFIPLVLQGVLAVSVTNSGLQLTPMMLGVVVMSVVSGNLMVRIRQYPYLGTIGIVLMAIGMYLIAQTTTATPQWHITVAIVIVGMGLGITFPLYINAVQSAVPQRYLGVASSQIQFWRQIGGTISTAVLGSFLASRLPGAVQEQMSTLKLPPGFKLSGGLGGNNPNALFDPNKIADAKAKLPPALLPLFDQILNAVRSALAATLHDLFLVALALTLVAAAISLFLPDVPLRSRARVELEQTPPLPEAAAAEA
jgi:MFS family permease